MLRYILVVSLIGVAFSDAYKPKNLRQHHLISNLDYADYDYDYLYPAYAKDSDGDNVRPSIFSYWNRLLKNARLPSLNITNPFTRLFTPYVIKVDFPADNNLNAEAKPPQNNNKKKPASHQQDYVYIDTDSERPQFIYDPVTQQYYEVQQTNSQNYDPQNNYYATTFNDNEEIVIDLGDHNNKLEKVQNQEDANAFSEEEEEYSQRAKKRGLIGIYNTPATRRFNVGRSEGNAYWKPLKRSKKVNRF